MKKVSIVARLIITVIIIGVLSSCSKQPEQIEKIPGVAGLVFSVDGKSLSDKGKFDEIEKMDMYKLLEKEIEREGPKFSDMFEEITDDSKATGIDLKSDMFFFLVNENRDEEYFGMVFKMINESAFEEFLEEFLDNAGMEMNIEEEEEYKYFSPDEEAYFAWDGNTLIILGTEDGSTEEYMGKYLDDIFMKPDASISGNKDFKDFYNNKTDLSFWMSYDKMMENMDLDIDREIQQMFSLFKLEGLYMHAYISFEENEIVIKGELTPEEVIEESLGEITFVKDNLDPDILDYLPENTYVAYSMALLPGEYFNWLTNMIPIGGISEQIKSEIGFSIENMLNSFDGDFVASITDIEMFEQTRTRYDYYQERYVEYVDKDMMPEFIVVGSINTDEYIRKFFDFAEDKAPADELEKIGDIYKIDADEIYLYIGWNDDVVIMSNSLDLCEDALDDEFDKTMKGTDIGEQMAQNSTFLYFDLEMDNYPIDAIDMMKDEMGRGEFRVFKEVMENFRMVTMRSNAGSFEFEMKIGTAEDGDNSLYTMMKMFDELIPMMD